MGEIAVIGWGSLIWDIDNLAPHVTGDWSLGTGPVLPLEFSRISPKRMHALALVIDPDHGAPCRTCHISSRRTDLEDAVADLAARERAPIERIGFLSKDGTRVQSRFPDAAEAVAEWLALSNFDGAVWTDLERNFEDISGIPFSVEAAVLHLRSLEGEPRLEAKRYIANAPSETDTHLRQRLESMTWWRNIPIS